MRILFSCLLILSQLSVSAQCIETPALNTNGSNCLGTAYLNVIDIASASQIVWYKNNVPVITHKALFYSGGSIAGGNGQGASATQLNYPNGVFVDNNGNIYVADKDNHRVQKFPSVGGAGVTVAGGNGFGAALNQLAYPTGVNVDNNGNIFISDNNNHRIVKWAPGAVSGTVVAGGNGQGAALNQLNYPGGLFVDKNGNIYVADNSNHRIVKWAPGAVSGTVVAGGNGQGSAANQLNYPHGVAADTAGNVYIADDNPKVQKWAPGATEGVTVAGTGVLGNAPNQLNAVSSVFIDRLGNLIIGDGNNDRIQRWAPGAATGETIAGGNGRGSGSNQLAYPSGVYADSSGNIFICDILNHRIQQWKPFIVKFVYPGDVPGPAIYRADITTFSGCNYTTGNVNIYPTGVPKAVVESNAYNDICIGDSVKFASFIITEGINPTYQWKRNNIDINGANTAYLVTLDITDGDVFSCWIVCNANGCLTNDTITVINDAIAVGHTYSFTGNGNWEDAVNWTGNKIPPDVLVSCSKIIIDPSPGGECVLNKPQIISSGAIFEVTPGKKFIIKGNLAIGNGTTDTIFGQYSTDTTRYGTGLVIATDNERTGIPYVERTDFSQIPILSRPSSLLPFWELEMPTPGAQGSANNCTAWAIGYGLFSYVYNKIEKNQKNNGAADYDGTDKTFSPAYIYNQLNGGTDNGITQIAALSLLFTQGCCKKADMPDFSNTTTQPSTFARFNAGAYVSSNFRSEQFATIDIDLIKSLLVSPGYPIPFGMLVDNSFRTCTGHNIITQPDGRKVWYDYSSNSNTDREPHAMLICGYDDAIRAFKVMNSWGTDKANNGFYWLNYNFFKNAVIKQVRNGVPFNPEIYYVYTTRPNINLAATAATQITSETAKAGGTIINNSNATITETGICYSKNINPTTASLATTNFTVQSNSAGSGSFIIDIVGLEPNTLYYYRAYAKTSQGIVYSPTDIFVTKPPRPTVTTSVITNVTHLTAKGGGTLTVSNGTVLLSKGVCWSNLHNPTVADKKTVENNTAGNFISQMDNLLAWPTYYVRAYAITESDTTYGNEVSFNTIPDSTFTDSRDGQQYTFRHIGSQVWMTKNLNYVTDSSWCYDSIAANCAIYGRLYNWNDAMIAAPPGWHLPSDAEWDILINHLGGYLVGGGAMKSTSTLWQSPNTGATNSSGWSGLPGGFLTEDVFPHYIGYFGQWWSSTENESMYAWSRYLAFSSANAYRDVMYEAYGYSVRCVRD